MFSETFVHSLWILFRTPKYVVIPDCRSGGNEKIGCRLVSNDLQKLILNAGKVHEYSTFGDHGSGFVERAMPPEVALAMEVMAISLLIKSMYPRGEILMVQTTNFFW